MKNLFVLFIFILIQSSCYKEDDLCTFNHNYFLNRVFTPTKIETMAGIDITSATMDSFPCAGNVFSFNTDSSYAILGKDTACHDSTYGRWRIASFGGLDYLLLDDDTAQILSADCDKVVFNLRSDTSYIKATYSIR